MVKGLVPGERVEQKGCCSRLTFFLDYGGLAVFLDFPKRAPTSLESFKVDLLDFLNLCPNKECPDLSRVTLVLSFEEGELFLLND